MPDLDHIRSRPYPKDSKMACPGCVWGHGEPHADFCEKRQMASETDALTYEMAVKALDMLRSARNADGIVLVPEWLRQQLDGKSAKT